MDWQQVYSALAIRFLHYDGHMWRNRTGGTLITGLHFKRRRCFTGTNGLAISRLIPKVSYISNNDISVQFLEIKTEIVCLGTGEQCLKIILSSEFDETMFLLFMGGFTTALLKQHNHLYIFDYHSWDERGLSVTGETSVL